MVMKTIFFSAAILCLLFVAVASPAKATIVDGSFNGTIYSYDGSTVSIPIYGTFSYDTTSFVPVPCATYCSIFNPVSESAIAITETSSIGTLSFASPGIGMFLETFQINFGAHAGSSPNYTELDSAFQSNVFTLGSMPISFSGNFVPYQGSSETYFNNGEMYDFYISQIEAAPVNTTPLPAALPLFATGLAALGLLGWRRKRKNALAAA